MVQLICFLALSRLGLLQFAIGYYHQVDEQHCNLCFLDMLQSTSGSLTTDSNLKKEKKNLFIFERASEQGMDRERGEMERENL